MEFETYVRQHAQALLRFATLLSDDPATAEDVVQEVLLRAHSRWPRIAATDRPHAYVRRMVVNETTSWHRKWGRVEARPDHDLDRAQRDGTGTTDARDEILRAVAVLPPRQRAALVLRYYEGLDDAEIAGVLGCRTVTVRGYLHRALKTLRVDLATDDTTRPVVATGRTSR